MAKFISIPVTNKGTTLIPTDGLVTTYVSATSIILAAGGRILTFVTVGATTAFTDAINTAATALNGPTVVPVALPTGQTITSIAFS
tara:strand:+ start:616 stop:873 length:258 start_codon:yes stop_codon:yes gene_type:complete